MLPVKVKETFPTEWPHCPTGKQRVALSVVCCGDIEAGGELQVKYV